MAGNHEGLTDSDIGMVDALSTIMEVFVALGIEPSVLSGPLEFQRDAQLAAGRTNAALVLDLLIDGVRDPERARRRQVLRLFRQEPPKGSA
jgi:hypothetical protein